MHLSRDEITFKYLLVVIEMYSLKIILYISAKPVVTRTTDVTAALKSDKKIKAHVFEELKNTDENVFKIQE